MRGTAPISDPERALLHRHRPLLRYDAQAAYRAVSAAAATDWPGNALRRSGGRALAVRGGVPNLTLGTLGAYPGGETARPDDVLDLRSDHLAAADRFQADPEYADRVYGRVFRGAGRTWLQYWSFYYHNPHAVLGFARHEGDWELVQVALDLEGRPVAVTYAQHTFGQAHPWPEVEHHPGPGGPAPGGLCRSSLERGVPAAGGLPLLRGGRPSARRWRRGPAGGGGAWAVV